MSPAYARLCRMRCLPWPAHSREKPASSHGIAAFNASHEERLAQPAVRHSVHRSGRGHVHELSDCTRDPAPDRHAGSVAHLPEFVGSSRAFRLSLIAVALEHQVSDAPNVDPGYHTREAKWSNFHRRVKRKEEQGREIGRLRDGRP